jgi:thiol:disulfide interchange protein DsbD
VSAAFAGPATAGGTAELRLTFALPDGYHAYHKDTKTVGGYGRPISVEFSDLAGLSLESANWPDARTVKIDEGWHELQYTGEVTLVFKFNVPSGASGDLVVAGGYTLKVENEAGGWPKEGSFSAPLTVTTAKTVPDRARKDEHGFYLDFDYAMEQAKKESKPLLVDFNGRNCPPCRKMEKQVFTLHEVEELLAKFVVASVKNDVEDPRYDELWAKYKPSPTAGVPYYAVMSYEGKVVRGIGSTLPAKERAHEFVAFLKGEPIPTGETKATTPPDLTTPKSDGWPKDLFGPPNEVAKTGFDFEARFSTSKIKSGGKVTLELHFNMKFNDKGEQYHLYHPNTKFGIPLSLEIKGAEGLEAVGEWQYPKPTIHVEEGIGETHELTGEVIIVHEFKIPDNAKPGSVRVFGTAAGQFCDEGGCIQFNRNDPKLEDRMFGWMASLEVSPEGADTAVTGASAAIGPGGEAGDDGSLPSDLWLFLLFAFGAGMVTLLTPCVLPVIPLTIGFFVGQAEKGKSALLTAFIYCACIIASFTAFGLLTSLILGATGAQNIATNGWVNSFLGALFLMFALSFLGLFELRVPGFMTAWFNKKQMSAQKEGHGYAKAFFSGSAFALISFSCTGPIAGAFLAEAARAGGEDAFAIWRPTLAMMAFASGMAVPIFIMGQFPTLMKKLPKSGGWMNALKVVFGFIEIGLAILYFSAAEQAFGSMKAAEWLNRYVVISVWIACSAASSLYLFGLFRMPHDHEKAEQIGVVRSIFAIMFLSFALYLVPGLFGARLGATLEGILPLPPKDSGIQLSWGSAGKGNDAEDLPWVLNLEEGLDVAAKVNKPVFVDFTGYN